MVDFDHKELRDKTLKRINETADDLYPTAEMILGIASGETSCLTVSIYPDEQTATDALMDRDKYQAQIDGAEIAVAFEGALKIFHQKSLIKTEN
tara:strand:- start:370 stop:651 length:282 start_codon:yes stop_codon:yes gene_type:complete